MSTSVDHLQERTQDASDLLTDIVPSAITLATMLRHRKMAAWLRKNLMATPTRTRPALPTRPARSYCCKITPVRLDSSAGG